MALPTEPPRYQSFRDLFAPLKQGSTGWPAFAVQKVVGATADGNWGPQTDQAVRGWQLSHQLHVDGIMGPVSQGHALELAGRQADRAHGLPEGVGYGFAVGEGAGVLAATNWSVAGGVDCGPAQWRVSGPPYDQDRLRYAFSPRMALDGATARLRAAQTDFERRNGYLAAKPQVALNVAVLQHNWPAGADSIVRTYNARSAWYRYCGSPDMPATWAKRADGSYYTRSEWCAHYVTSILRFVV